MPCDKVLLISIDNLRYDCIGAGNKVNTPVINEISEKAAVFKNCFSTNTYTTSAHASMFTGLLPQHHGVRPYYYKKLSDKSVTLAEIFKKNGYKTVFSTDIPELFEPLGLARGFDYKITRNDAQLFELLDGMKNEKVFLFIHFFDVHEPYLFSECPPDNNYNGDYFKFIEKADKDYDLNLKEKEPHKIWREFAGKIKSDVKILFEPYIEGVNKFDGGRFKTTAGFLKKYSFFDDDNVYAITSDHGEGRVSIDDPDYFSHAGELYDEVTHVPLIFHGPNMKAGSRKDMVSITDIFPSVLSQAGINPSFVCGDIDGLYFHDRDYVYSEVWKQNNYLGGEGALSGEDGRPVIAKRDSSDEYFLFQRCLRFKDKKIVFSGNYIENGGSYESFDARTQGFKNSDADYVKSLYRNILLRFEDKEGLSAKLNMLGSQKYSRKDIFDEFWGSMEKAGLKIPDYVYKYDLINDPLENTPLDVSEQERTDYVKTLDKLEKDCAESENVFQDDESGFGDGYDIPSGIINTAAAAEKEAAAKEENAGGGNASGLSRKIDSALETIKEARRRFGEDIGVGFTGGKDSTVLLYLIKKAFNGIIPFKVINIDTGLEFKEIYAFIGRIKNEWALDLRVFSEKDSLMNIKADLSKEECCLKFKTVPLKKAVTDLKLKALMTGVRRDEHPARSDETFFSERDNPTHTRVHPILQFTEKDIWNFIRAEGIPYCGLYDEGYRSLDCEPCTGKSDMNGPERSGRSSEKDSIMDKLRSFGYF